VKNDKKVKVFMSDNGIEIASNAMGKYLAGRGIRQNFTAADSPQSNGMVERMNYTILDRIRTFVAHNNLNEHLWGELATTAVYLLNRTPNMLGQTLYAGIFAREPTLDYLREIGSKVIFYTHEKNKLQPRGAEGVLVGYDDQRRAYRIFVKRDRSIAISRDVKFCAHSQSTSVNVETQTEQNDRIREVCLSESLGFLTPFQISNRDDYPEWLEALEKEHQSLLKHNVFTVVPRPKEKKVLGTRWVLVEKFNTLKG
jgi:hypothetical protein